MFTARSAGYLAVGASIGSLLACLIYVPALVLKISEINRQLQVDSDEFRVMADDAWSHLMAIKSGEPPVRRPRRQASYNGTETPTQPPSGGYASPGTSLPRVFPIPPLPPGYGQGPDVFIEKPSTGGYGGGGGGGQCACDAENKCPAGPAGVPGTPGEDGMPGLPGKAGEKGMDGNFPQVTIDPYAQCRSCPRGPKGQPGDPGPMGEIGPPGLVGPPGKPGQDGRPGFMGEPGLPGEHAKQGLPGPPGPPGRNGTRGTKGPPGKKGDKGKPGAKGPHGDTGRDGQRGGVGRMGPVGQPGLVGMPGMVGSKGPSGIPGSPGDDGSYCPCPPRSSGVNNPSPSTGTGYNQSPSPAGGYNRPPSPGGQPPAIGEVYAQPSTRYNPAAPSPGPTSGSGYRPAPTPSAPIVQPQYPEQPGYPATVGTQPAPAKVRDPSDYLNGAVTSDTTFAQSPAPAISGSPDTWTSENSGGFTETQGISSGISSNGGVSFETQAVIEYSEQTLAPPAFNYQGSWTSAVQPPAGSAPTERPPYRHYRDQPVKSEIEDMRNPLTFW